MFAVALCWTAPASAQLDDGDIVLTLNASPRQIVINRALATGSLRPWSVFSTSFDELNFTDEPGFDNQPGTFMPQTAVGFTLVRPLERWTGSGFVAQALPGQPMPRIRVIAGLEERLSPTPQSPLVSGAFLSVAANGSWHRHYGFRIEDDFGGPPSGSGIYALWMTLQYSLPSQASEAFAIIFNHQRPEEELAAAVANLEAAQGLGCAADIGGGGAAEAPDGVLDNNDFVVFINWFFAQDARADLGGQGASEQGDGAFDNNDFVVFIQRFFAGC